MKHISRGGSITWGSSGIKGPLPGAGVYRDGSPALLTNTGVSFWCVSGRPDPGSSEREELGLRTVLYPDRRSNEVTRYSKNCHGGRPPWARRNNEISGPRS